MHQKRNDSSYNMKNYSNITPQKENDNSPETNFKVTEYCDLTEGDFKTAVMKKLSEIQENTESSLMRSEIKLMNIKNTLPESLKL